MDSAGAAVVRVRIEVPKWRACVLKPKVYGTKVVSVQTVPLPPASEEENIVKRKGRYVLLRERLTSFADPTEQH